MTAHIRGIPDQLRCFCGLCPYECDSIPAMIEHIDSDHEHHPDAQRWPDGGVVVDMSEVPELMGGGGGHGA